MGRAGRSCCTLPGIRNGSSQGRAHQAWHVTWAWPGVAAGPGEKPPATWARLSVRNWASKCSLQFRADTGAQGHCPPEQDATSPSLWEIGCISQTHLVTSSTGAWVSVSDFLSCPLSTLVRGGGVGSHRQGASQEQPVGVEALSPACPALRPRPRQGPASRGRSRAGRDKAGSELGMSRDSKAQGGGSALVPCIKSAPGLRARLLQAQGVHTLPS